MARIRIVRGKSVKKTGGNHTIYAGASIRRTAEQEICDRGKSGLRFNLPQPPERRAPKPTRRS